MKHFVKKHKQKLIVGNGVIVFALLAASSVTFNSGTTTLFFTPQGDEKILVGATTDVDVNVNTKTAINALGATIKFPEDILEIVAISKKKTFFDLWTEDTIISEEQGEIRFSGGTVKQGGLLGTGTVLTLTVRALRPGTAEIFFKDAEIYGHDGSGLVLDRNMRTLTYTVTPLDSITGVVNPTKETSFTPNADFNGDGRVSLVDVSILAYKLVGSYDPRFDLDTDGKLGLSDLSIIFAKL